MSTREAFFGICADAQPAKRSYVSLYMRKPFYGGPEEGGWWGSDVELVAYQECTNDIDAQAIYGQVTALAARLSREAKSGFNQQCARECEWLEARGLDADFLPEVDGEVSYFVTTESRPGEQAYQGGRGYE